jgi:hypothetical protein
MHALVLRGNGLGRGVVRGIHNPETKEQSMQFCEGFLTVLSKCYGEIETFVQLLRAELN